MILNINGIENIKLSVSENILETVGQKKRFYFEITKDQLYKLCMAKNNLLQVNDWNNAELFEREANCIIPMLQVLYNEAIDNSLFEDAKNKALRFLNNKVAILEEENRKVAEKNKQDNVYQTVFFIIMGIVFGILRLPSHKSIPIPETHVDTMTILLPTRNELFSIGLSNFRKRVKDILSRVNRFMQTMDSSSISHLCIGVYSFNATVAQSKS